QPHGFERLLMVKEILEKDDAAFADGGDFRDGLLSLNAALLPAHTEAEANENAIAEVDDLFNVGVRSHRFPHVPEVGDPSLAAINELLRPPRIGPDKDMWIETGRDGAPIAASVRIVEPPEEIDVLLRHRLPRQAEVGEGRRYIGVAGDHTN